MCCTTGSRVSSLPSCLWPTSVTRQVHIPCEIVCRTKASCHSIPTWLHSDKLVNTIRVFVCVCVCISWSPVCVPQPSRWVMSIYVVVVSIARQLLLQYQPIVPKNKLSAFSAVVEKCWQLIRPGGGFIWTLLLSKVYTSPRPSRASA